MNDYRIVEILRRLNFQNSSSKDILEINFHKSREQLLKQSLSTSATLNFRKIFSEAIMIFGNFPSENFLLHSIIF